MYAMCNTNSLQYFQLYCLHAYKITTLLIIITLDLIHLIYGHFTTLWLFSKQRLISSQFYYETVNWHSVVFRSFSDRWSWSQTSRPRLLDTASPGCTVQQYITVNHNCHLVTFQQLNDDICCVLHPAWHGTRREVNTILSFSHILLDGK